MPSNGQGKQRTICLILEILIPILLILPAIVFSVNFKSYFRTKVLNKLELKPNSEGFHKWLNPPITTVRSYRLFNITNPSVVMVEPATAIINVTETRPYTYSIEVKKNNIQWLNDSQDLSYSVERFFHRHPQLFEPSFVDDSGAFVDMLRAIFRTQFDAKPAPAFYELGSIFPFYHRSPVEQLEGFTSDLFESMKDKMVGPNTAKSGLIYRYNTSRLYNVSIKAGLMEKGQVHRFASELVHLNVTSSDYPFPIYDGLTFAPMLFNKPILYIFQSDLCQPIRLKFVKKVPLHGLELHQYTIQFVDFTNCTNSTDEDTCPEIDLLDVSKCMSSTLPEKTFLFSKAHFYGASNETTFNLKIEGLEPDETKHDSYIYFEPITGTPIQAVYRMQLNIEATLDPLKVSDEEDGVPFERTKKKGVKRFIPLMWIDQKIDISEAVISQLKFAQTLLDYGSWIIMLLAIVLSIIIIIILEFIGRRAERNDRYRHGSYMRTEALVQY